MNSIRRLTALVACCASALGLSAPPPPATTSTTPPLQPVVVAAEYPLSCNTLAKPLVFRGWTALSNSRTDEAREALKMAVAADPKCVIARASLANISAGAEARLMFEDAMKEVGAVTEVERLDMQAMEASRSADPEKAFLIAEKMAEIAPRVFFVNLTLAHSAAALEKWDEAGLAAKKATELSPRNGAGWNLLGYTRIETRRYDEAIAAFRKYVELEPNEPNAHDSLADALLASDRLDEAVGEYQKAIDNSGGKFWPAWSGIATVRAIRGDWEGARIAIAAQKAAALTPMDKVNTNTMTAWTWVAQGKLAEAHKVVDLIQKEATAAKLDWALTRAQVLRGQLDLAAGKYADALKAFHAADKLKVSMLTAGQQKQHRSLVLSGLVEAQARLGKTADAEKTLTSLHDFVRANLTGPFAADTMAFGHGLVALARKDLNGAIESFKNCSETFDSCHLSLAETQEKAGLSAAAAQTRASIVKANHRDPHYWFVRAQVESKRKAPGT